LVANPDQRAVWSSVLAASSEDAGTLPTVNFGDACHPDFADAGIPDWLAQWGDGGQAPAWMGENDADNDNVPDALDNCTERFNPSQQDRDGDGRGDLCDEDMDGDGYANEVDVCPFVFNPDQADADNDGDGDRCDGDWDNDGILNDTDDCPHVWGEYENGCQAMPEMIDDAGSSDAGEMWLGDAGPVDAGTVIEVDKDQDQVPDFEDNCPENPNREQEDVDRDGIGDVCDEDDDGDGVADENDTCPLDFNPAQIDLDQDGIGDECDLDVDGDEILNVEDACPYWPNTRDDMNQVAPCGGTPEAAPSSCNQNGLGGFAVFLWVLMFGWFRKRRHRAGAACTSPNQV
jgi:hypothetical protein